MFLPCPRWKPPDHRDGRTMWPLCLFPVYTEPWVADLHCGYWTWLWSSSSGGLDRHHGMLCLRAYLKDCWESGWWNTVSWRATNWIWLCSLPSGLEQWGNSANMWKPLSTVWAWYLQNWMGLLLYRWWSCGCNVNMHMAVLFLWKEAKAISILTRNGDHHQGRILEEYNSTLWTELSSGTLCHIQLCSQNLCFANCLQIICSLREADLCLVYTAASSGLEWGPCTAEILPCF